MKEYEIQFKGNCHLARLQEKVDKEIDEVTKSGTCPTRFVSDVYFKLFETPQIGSTIWLPYGMGSENAKSLQKFIEQIEEPNKPDWSKLMGESQLRVLDVEYCMYGNQSEECHVVLYLGL